jgi:hypothetical protein
MKMVLQYVGTDREDFLPIFSREEIEKELLVRPPTNSLLCMCLSCLSWRICLINRSTTIAEGCIDIARHCLSPCWRRCRHPQTPSRLWTPWM